MARLMQQFRRSGLSPQVFRWPNWAAPADFDRRVSLLGYAFLLICSGCFTWLISIDRPLLGRLVLEDGLLENLTVAFYVVAALLLLAAAAERQWPGRCLCLLGAAICGFVAGEEIDWGQRLLGYATPEWFVEVNFLDTANFHNSEFGKVTRLFQTLKVALPFVGCLTAFAAWVCGKNKLLHLPLPSMPLVLGLLLALSYWESASIARLEFAAGGATGLLWLIGVYALLARQSGLFLAAAAAALSVDAINYANLTTHIGIGADETYEYLLAAAALCYALELLLRLRSRRREPPAPAGPPLPARPRPGRLRRPWLVFCALAIGSSLALYPWEYFNSRAETATAQEHWQRIHSGAAGRPLGSENFEEVGAAAPFEVYALAGQLLYTAPSREQCRKTDLFFLHIFPVNSGDLPPGRQEYGYDNQDFYFAWRRQFIDGGRCVGVVPLPDYPIAEVRTGEVRWQGTAHWQARLVVDSSGYQAAYAAAVPGRPAARAAFDVYLSAEALTWIKEECTTADTAGMFILHAFPANPGDLPEWRQGEEFDNLDFQFSRLGARFDGKCVAVVPLPDYPLDRLRVGQWLPQENRQLWSAEFPARR